MKNYLKILVHFGEIYVSLSYGTRDGEQKILPLYFKLSQRTIYTILSNNKIGKRWAKENQERVTQKNKQYYSKNKITENQRTKAYYQENIDSLRTKSLQYARTHKKERKEYRQRNAQAINELTRKRRSLQKEAFLGYLPKGYFDLLFSEQSGMCMLCDKKLSGKIEVDHKIPITSERSIECICNFQLAHKTCNVSKFGHILPEYEELNQLSLQLDAIREGEVNADCSI